MEFEALRTSCTVYIRTIDGKTGLYKNAYMHYYKRYFYWICIQFCSNITILHRNIFLSVQCTSVQRTCTYKRGCRIHCTGVHCTLGRFTLYKHNGQYLASLTVISVHNNQGVRNRREIQLTRFALPYDYTCFADGTPFV